MPKCLVAILKLKRCAMYHFSCLNNLSCLSTESTWGTGMFISSCNVSAEDWTYYSKLFPFLQLLGLQGSLSNLQEARIITAFEELSNSILENGYSKSIEDGRISLLHAAVDGVRRLRGMASRTERPIVVLPEHTHASIQWTLVPAALSLLQEVSITLTSQTTGHFPSFDFWYQKWLQPCKF